MSPDCRKCRQFISAYLDGETTQAEEQFIREHTQTCPECREAWRAYQGIRSQFQNLPHPIPSPALRQAVLAGVRSGGRATGVRRQPNRGGLVAGGLFGRSVRVGMGLVTAAIIFVIAVAVLIASIVTTPKTFEVVANATDQLPTGRNYISLKFTKPVNEDDLRSHLNISVPVKVEVVGDGTEARLTPLQDLTPNQTVSISIEGLRDKNNEPLKNNKVDIVYKVVDPTATAVPPTNTPKPATATPTPKPNVGQPTTAFALPTSTPKPSQPTTTAAAPATPTPPPAITATPIPAPTTTRPPVATTSVPTTSVPTTSVPTTIAITTTSPPTKPAPSPGGTLTVTITVTATTTITASPPVTATTTPAPTTIAPTTITATLTTTTPAPTTTSAPTTVAPTTIPAPGSACAILPVSGFGLVYASTPGLPAKMGCPTEHEHNILMAYRAFEYGFMFYEHETERIWVFYNRTGIWEAYANDNSTTPPASYGTKPPPGKYEPDRGFGKVWYNNKLQSKLGWSTQPQEYTNGLGAAQLYERGMMLFTPGGEPDGHKHIYVLYNDGTFINIIDKTG